jgi:sulfoxide reductase heme-binding subunit YedZ
VPSAQTVRRVYKPILFVLSLVPCGMLLWQALGINGSSLGANAVEHLQDTFGEWGLRFLVLTLAITPLREWTGAPWLTGLRRMLGLFAFFYVAMHFLTWIVLDQGLDPASLRDIVTRPYLTIGMLAFLGLVPLAITSTDAMMRRLGKRWRQLHRVVYACALLGTLHFYLQVKSDVGEPLIYLGIFVVLLAWRVLKTRQRAIDGRRAAPSVESARKSH